SVPGAEWAHLAGFEFDLPHSSVLGTPIRFACDARQQPADVLETPGHPSLTGPSSAGLEFTVESAGEGAGQHDRDQCLAGDTQWLGHTLFSWCDRAELVKMNPVNTQTTG